MTTQATTSSLATLVPQDRREAFLPALFGLPLLIVAESENHSEASEIFQAID